MISCKRVLRMLLETTTELKGKQADETEHNYSCLQRRTILRYVITQPDRLAEGLTEILSNAKLREQIMGNARALAARNHDPEINVKKLYQCLERTVEKQKILA